MCPSLANNKELESLLFLSLLHDNAVRVTMKGCALAPQTRYRVSLQGAGKQQGIAIRVEEREKQLDALQPQVVAEEEENHIIRERAETAGTTAAGKA